MIDNTTNTDILIAGGGLAAIKAAYECSKSGLRVTLVVKDRLCSGASFYPFVDILGCQCPRDDEKDKHDFFEEIEQRSLGMNDYRLTRIYIDELRSRITELPEIGINYKKLPGEKIACFAIRPRDVYIWGNWDLIRSNLYGILSQKNNVEIHEGTSIIDLVKSGDRIAAAQCIDKKGSKVLINTKAVILATGGYGDIYKHNLNPADISGDGHILALDAGAKLINMEFIQFIPGFIKPLYKTVFREGGLLHIDSITDSKGRDVLSKYLPDGVSFEDCIKERSTHGPFSNAGISKYFDIAMMKEIQRNNNETGFKIKYTEDIQNSSQASIRIYVEWLKGKGLDIAKHEIFIAPFYHAANGGIRIDERCGTGVGGLFAAGEAAGGIHGADRLGGNMTGSCLVFGKIAADSAIDYARSHDASETSKKEAERSFKSKYDSGTYSTVEPEYIISRVKEIMWLNGNVVRNGPKLENAIGEIDDIQKRFNAIKHMSDDDSIMAAVKAHNYIKLGKLLLGVMLLRKESRGPHFREDYPDIDYVKNSGKAMR